MYLSISVRRKSEESREKATPAAAAA